MPSSLEDYEFISSIGSGSYGSCAKIRRIKDGKMLVWKVLDYLKMSDAEKQMLVSEVNLLRELKHERIVRYYDRIIDRRHSRLYIVMEYCEGGDLADLISRHKKDGSRVEESFVWQVCQQVACALQECHCRRARKGKSVMHRDLKPANVFLDARHNVKLGDFGMARVLNHESSFASTFVGTPYYMSPELMNGHQYNEKSDVWSLGCLLYELCALAPPFQATSHAELAQRICSGRYPPLPPPYSADLRDLVSLLLQVEGHRRPSIEALLSHALLLKNFPPPACSLCGHIKSSESSIASSASSSDPPSGGGLTENLLRRREEALVASEAAQTRRESELNLRAADLLTRGTDLDRRERELEGRERTLERREREVERRERGLGGRERLVEERMIKAERLLEEYADARLRLHAKKSFGSNATLSSDTA